MDPQSSTRSMGAFSFVRRLTLDLRGGSLSWAMMAAGMDGIWEHVLGLRKNINNGLTLSSHRAFSQVFTPIRCSVFMTTL